MECNNHVLYTYYHDNLQYKNTVQLFCVCIIFHVVVIFNDQCFTCIMRNEIYKQRIRSHMANMQIQCYGAVIFQPEG